VTTDANTYDAIVVGSGISGGWAAKELTEKGLRVLVLERGQNIEHIKDYVNATKNPWDYPHRGGRTARTKIFRSCPTDSSSPQCR
jgi:choline dehydrogenase-like flavoprotein